MGSEKDITHPHGWPVATLRLSVGMPFYRKDMSENLAIQTETAKSVLNYAASVIVSKSYNGYEVELTKNENGIVYVNLTEVAKAFPNKNLSTIVNSQEIREYCETLSKLKNFSLADLLIVKRGGNDNGTWAHQKVALRVAQKLSPEFAVMVDTWIEELLTTGQAQIKPLTPAQQLLANAQMLVEMEQRQIAMESKVEQIESRIRANGFMSVMGFANIHHLNIGKKAAQAIGRLASKWCKRNDRVPEKTRHERWGEVNTYPMEALRYCFSEFYPDKRSEFVKPLNYVEL